MMILSCFLFFGHAYGRHRANNGETQFNGDTHTVHIPVAADYRPTVADPGAEELAALYRQYNFILHATFRCPTMAKQRVTA